MGCDVHVHIEVKLDDRWEHYALLRPDRDYRIFQLLAGVRGDEYDPVTPCKNKIPVDVTSITRSNAAHWNMDAHHPSWLDAQEIAAFDAALGGIDVDLEQWLGCYLFGNSFSGFLKYPYERFKGLTDVRFIFWFDN